jgi:hypothetical protein
MATWECGELHYGAGRSNGSWEGPGGQHQEIEGGAVAFLNVMGGEGWEVVAKTHTDSQPYNWLIPYLLKRQQQE